MAYTEMQSVAVVASMIHCNGRDELKHTHTETII